VKIAIAKNHLEHKLFALQAEWDRCGPLAREAIASSIREHPEWGIEIDDTGPRFKLSIQTPQN
jgi:hypothetical protein